MHGSGPTEAIVCPAKGANVIAHAREGMIADDLDVAIAEIADGIVLDSTIYTLPGPPDRKAPKKITPKEVDLKLEVNIYGRHSGKQNGIIKGFASQTIPYTNKSWVTLHDLIAVEKISEGGDSGAVAVTNSGAVVGMVVGGDDKQSYLIPIGRILSHLKVQIA